MKRRMMSLLAAAMMLTTAIVPASYAFAEEDLVLSVPGNEQVMDKTDEESVLDEMNSANESILGALGKKDWEALAKSVEKTGDWREDLVAIAQSQVGYTEESDGTTIYADWAGYENGANWTALFVNWVANKAGLTTKQFPSGDSYASLVNAMRKVNAVKTISRSNYPVSGDLALIKANGQELVAFVVYVSNGYASVIHGDDQGAVTRVTYRVSSSNFSTYIDLNELLERAGVEVGKGGKVPVIPAEGIAAWTNTNAVYMRSEASTASKRVTTLKRSNTAVLVTDAEMGDDGYIWYAVKYSRYTGYIRSDLLKLDQEALSAAQPTAVPTATPTAAPTAEPTAEPTAIPGCVLCAQEANGAELPVECCYAQLKGMTAQESYEFMSKLLAEDYVTFVLYVNCHNAHVYDGSNDAVICYTGCEESIFAPVAPGAAHSVNCGWYIEAAVTEAPAVTVVPTAAPTVVPAVTPAPTAAPTAEPTEAPTAEPTAEPTTAPTEAPVAPSSCSLCAAESEYWGVALPANGCVYDYLSGMTANEAYEVLNDLDWNNYSGYRMYLDCHNDHVLAGEAAVICYGDVCGAGTWTQPGDAHAAGCPWYAEAGLSVQERVVNVAVAQGGNAVTIKFPIFAAKYDWYRVGTGVNGTDELLPGGSGTTIGYQTYTATTSGTYYCVATLDGGFTVTSKPTVVSIAAATPIEAEAIIGEEINFTFDYNASSYTWMVTTAAGTEGSELSGSAYIGANTNWLAFQAALADNGNLYYCVATTAEGEVVTSPYYKLTIKTEAELTAADLCKYVDELAQLGSTKAFELMDGLWTESLEKMVIDHWKAEHFEQYPDLLCSCGKPEGVHADSCLCWVKTEAPEEPEVCEVCGANATAFPTAKDGTNYECAYEYLQSLGSSQARYEYFAWLYSLTDNSGQIAALVSAYDSHVKNSNAAPLLCVQTEGGCIKYGGLRVAPGTAHVANCPWYMTENLWYTTEEEIEEVKSQAAIAERTDNDAEFAAWIEESTTTDAMIDRAMTVKKLNYMVFTDDGKLYVASEATPCATVDADGYITDINTGLVIARLYEGDVYPIAEDPATASE